MESEWVRERLRKYEAKIAKEKRQEQWRSNAVAAYASKCDELKQQVETDVASYNALFAAHQGCTTAKFSSRSDGFIVERGDVSLIVTRGAGTTVINVEYPREGGRTSSFEHLEVAADETGTLCYKHKEEFLGVDAASERILDRIIC